MAKTPEARVRDPVLKYAHAKGVRTIRMFFGPGIQTGWPDDLFLIPGGRPMFIEFKAPGKKATPLQAKKIKLLKDAGYDVRVYDNSGKAIKAIARALAPAPVPGEGGRVPPQSRKRRTFP